MYEFQNIKSYPQKQYGAGALVKEVPDLMIYFPEYTSNQTPEKNYLFTILGVLRGEELKELIQEAREKRLIYEESDINY